MIVDAGDPQSADPTWSWTGGRPPVPPTTVFRSESSRTHCSSGAGCVCLCSWTGTRAFAGIVSGCSVASPACICSIPLGGRSHGTGCSKSENGAFLYFVFTLASWCRQHHVADINCPGPCRTDVASCSRLRSANGGPLRCPVAPEPGWFAPPRSTEW